jgi:hypothetical protein
MVIPQKKMRGAIRIQVQNCPAFSIRIVESDAIAELGHEKQAVALSFCIVETKVHTAVVEYPDTTPLIARSVVEDNARRRNAPLLGLSLNNRVWHWCTQDEPHDAAGIHNRYGTGF